MSVDQLLVRILELLLVSQDGTCVWKVSRGRCKQGSLAGSTRQDGYRTVTIDKKAYLVHHIVWLVHRGYLPKQLDHIDHNPSNNQISNLREVSSRDNSKNQSIRVDNTSGISGVHWSTSKTKWEQFIRTEQGREYLGQFKCLLDAAQARKSQERKYNYHENHGS